MSLRDRIFRRNRDDESDDLSVYKNEPSNGKLASLLFGIFALFVTLLIAGGLFFGGRAVYRALNGSPAEDTSQQGKDTNAEEKKTAEPASGSSSGDSQSTDTSQPSQSPRTGDTPTSVPATGDTPLPRTGDPGL